MHEKSVIIFILFFYSHRNGIIFVIAVIVIGVIALLGNLAVIASMFMGDRMNSRKTVLGYVKASLAMADFITGDFHLSTSQGILK